MADTVFKLNRVESRVGPIALVTVDNGEDYRKPTTLGRSAFESAVSMIEQLESGDWSAMVVTGKPFVFCVGADIDESLQFAVELVESGGIERAEPDWSELEILLRKARSRVDDAVHGATRAPYVALDLIAGAQT